MRFIVVRSLRERTCRHTECACYCYHAPMAKLFDQVLVIDIESTCWQGPPPRGQLSEIIEIGLCAVDLRTLERLEKRSIMVKPVRSRVSEFCTSLTTLTNDDVVNAG